MTTSMTSDRSDNHSPAQPPAALVAKVGLAATLLLTPLAYIAQRQEDPDIALSQTISTLVAGLIGTAVATFLTAWAGPQPRRAGRTAVTLAVATLVLLPLAWWSPLPIATGTAANRLARHTTSPHSTLHRLAAVGGIVLAALSATALVAASIVALI